MTKFLLRRTLTFTIDLFTYWTVKSCKEKNSLHMHFKSFTLLITVKAIVNLNLGHRNKFEIEFYKISRRGSILRALVWRRRNQLFAGYLSSRQTTQNWSFHVLVLQRTAKKCTKNYNARAQPLFCSLRPWQTRTHFFRHKCFSVLARAQHFLRTQKMFLILFRNILCPQQMFPSLHSPRNSMGNNMSATMCPRLPGPLNLYFV